MTTESSAALPTADFGTRFSAFMIDAGVLFAAQWLVFLVLARQLQAVGLTSTEPCVENSVALCEGPSTILWVLLVLVFVGSTVGYHAVFEGIYGATPGKRWMGLSVVDRDGATPIGLLAGLLRSVIRQSFWLSLLFVFEVSPLGLGLPPVLFLSVPILMLGVFVCGAVRVDGLAVHDLVAKTQVVDTALVPTALVRPAPVDREPSSAESGEEIHETEESEESV